jgi:hypothetical protein
MAGTGIRRRFYLHGGMLLLGLTITPAAISAPKLDLIKQAMVAMKIDTRIHGLVAQRIDTRMQRLRIDNPDLPDSAFREMRVEVSAVHAAHMDGTDGLLPRIYGILDKRLTEEDLKFAVNFRGSDQGKRYREMVPRIVQEAVDTGRDWAERLEPEIQRRLEDRFPGTEIKL